ncbi:GPO family capsid scaffolding protein [Chitinimonas arctica]|uniref:GPO family capsid scaffolding protein n=2 Tax=Chitinimonas arctica TaxID=2594795 RepID=A0A516SLU4_9NEIS|nr:GPO family capsid scaffolding protein [Chitinimonas arctica]
MWLGAGWCGWHAVMLPPSAREATRGGLSRRSAQPARVAGSRSGREDGCIPQTEPAMNQKTKLFRIATEGKSIDGRVIPREWITQMAATFDPKTYGARIWLEHIRGTLPESPYKAYGDVLALEARDIGGGKQGLYAQLDATPELVAMNKASQKVYTSIEVEPDFAGTGQAYLVGLGVTDSPASLGTERLAFSATHLSRQLSETTLFSPAIAADFALADEDSPSLFSAALEKLNKLLSSKQGKNDKQFSDVAQVLESVAEGMGDLNEQLGDVASLKDSVSRLETELGEAREEFRQLKAEQDKQPVGKPRPFATGGNAGQFTVTDC